MSVLHVHRIYAQQLMRCMESVTVHKKYISKRHTVIITTQCILYFFLGGPNFRISWIKKKNREIRSQDWVDRWIKKHSRATVPLRTNKIDHIKDAIYNVHMYVQQQLYIDEYIALYVLHTVYNLSFLNYLTFCKNYSKPTLVYGSLFSYSEYTYVHIT